MRSRLLRRVKALAERMVQLTKEPKSLMPDWLAEDLQKQGIQFNSAGFIDQEEWRAAENRAESSTAS